ncbi:hypothetical protein PIIN_11642, partial [Serendipita indica DSM 11827]
LVVFLAFPSGVVSSGWRIKSNLVFIGKGTFRSAVNFSKYTHYRQWPYVCCGEVEAKRSSCAHDPT